MENNGLDVGACRRRLHCVFEQVQIGGKNYLRQLSCALPYKEVQAGESWPLRGHNHDAMEMAHARKAKATHTYTWNALRLQMVAPDLAERIMTP